MHADLCNLSCLQPMLYEVALLVSVMLLQIQPQCDGIVVVEGSVGVGAPHSRSPRAPRDDARSRTPPSWVRNRPTSPSPTTTTTTTTTTTRLLPAWQQVLMNTTTNNNNKMSTLSSLSSSPPSLLIFFSHIMKTGGTSLSELLGDVFADAPPQCLSVSHASKRFSAADTAQMKGWTCEQWRDCPCLFSHDRVDKLFDILRHSSGEDCLKGKDCLLYTSPSPRDRG